MNLDEYKTLLKRGRGVLPEQVFEKSRFVIPIIESFVEGSRTYVTNWKDIAKKLNRESKYIAKYIAHEFATSANEEGNRLILQGKFGADSLNKQIRNYSNVYVICPECGKPDTKLTKEGRVVMKICEACGARSNIRT